MASGNPILNALNRVSLVAQIAIGLVLGIIVGAVSPQVGISAGLLGRDLCKIPFPPAAET